MARTYRMCGAARVCFDIEAESEEEAITKAKATMVLSAEFDNETDGLEYARTYLAVEVDPEVEDWWDDGEDSA